MGIGLERNVLRDEKERDAKTDLEKLGKLEECPKEELRKELRKILKRNIPIYHHFLNSQKA